MAKVSCRLVPDQDPTEIERLMKDHLGIREVKYFRAARLRVETEVPFDVYADGEYVCRTPVEVGVQGAALKVLTA